MGENFSDMLFTISSCAVQSSPLILPHFSYSEFFFLYRVSSQSIELSFLTAAFDIFFRGRWARTKVIKAAHCFIRIVAIRKDPINCELVNFLSSACCIKTSNYIFWSCSLKVEKYHIFKAVGLVSSDCEYTRL